MKKWALFISGVLIMDIGIVLWTKVEFLGIHPWIMFFYALSVKTGSSIGFFEIATGVPIVLLFLLTGSRNLVGLVTVFSALLNGFVLNGLLLIPVAEPVNQLTAWCLLVGASILSGVGGGLLNSANMGMSYRTGFVTWLSHRSGRKFLHVKLALEGVLLVVSYLLGGTLFVGTLVIFLIDSVVISRVLAFFKQT